MKTPATTVRTTFTAVSDEARSSTACEARAPMGKAHERATTAAVSERRELAPRRAIATVKAATSCSAHTVMGTVVAASTDVEGADASTIPSIMACIIHALTRRVTAHVRCHRAGCHNRVRAGSSSLAGSLSKLAAAAVRSLRMDDGPLSAWPSSRACSAATGCGGNTGGGGGEGGGEGNAWRACPSGKAGSTSWLRATTHSLRLKRSIGLKLKPPCAANGSPP